MGTIRNFAILAGRIFIAAIFIYDATLLARFPDINIAFMESFGVPGFLLWPTALFQSICGLLVVAGLLTRPAALALAGFCLLTAIIFHHNFADLNEIIQFGKDIGLAGGFLILAAGGPGTLSLDALWERR